MADFLREEVRLGKKDLTLKSYLSDPARYADAYNGSVFGGAQVLDGTQLEEAGTAALKTEDGVSLERTSDIVMRQKTEGGLFALWILENQEHVDYGMPVRVLLREALEYNRQVRELMRKNVAGFKEKGHEKPTAGEYLYRVRKEDRLRPVVTLVIYWGNGPWDGPRSLHELLDFGGADSHIALELKRLVPECPLHILDINETNDYSGFCTSLRTVFELYARRTDKGQFMEYVESHEECRHLDQETYRVIGQMIGSKALQKIVNKQKDIKEEQDMCQAIEDLIADGKAEERKRIIDTLMEKLCCSLEEACDVTGIPVEEYQQSAGLQASHI